MRLDKFICDMNIGSRSESKELIKKGKISVNGIIVKNPNYKINEEIDEITCNGEILRYQSFHYYMVNKPRETVSATEDNICKTVLELLPPKLRKGVFPIGRLDKDTTGLLLLTDDGALCHELLSPKKHVNKTYLVTTKKAITKEQLDLLEHGLDIGEEKPTLPASAEKIGEYQLILTIHEGKFHQVKRMLLAVGNEVDKLHRCSFGNLTLDETLQPGMWRSLAPEEVDILKHASHNFKTKMLQGMKAIIFDLDGTLVDSMWMWRQIDIEYLGRFHIPLPENLQEEIEGMSFHETAVYFKERFQIEDSLEKIKADWNEMALDKYKNEVPLKPGVKSFLRACYERGILMGIATSNSKELVETIVRAQGLQNYFQCIMTSGEVGKGKPAPDIYLAVANKLSVLPEHCLVFEDIIPGILSGKSAGMKVCAVEDSYSMYQRQEKQELADYYIEDFYGYF